MDELYNIAYLVDRLCPASEIEVVLTTTTIKAKKDYKVRITMAKCARCHKQFIPTYKYVYKDGSKKYCSWRCLNASKYKGVNECKTT
jgi:hypothetical protein